MTELSGYQLLMKPVVFIATTEVEAIC